MKKNVIAAVLAVSMVVSGASVVFAEKQKENISQQERPPDFSEQKVLIQVITGTAGLCLFMESVKIFFD